MAHRGVAVCGNELERCHLGGFFIRGVHKIFVRMLMELFPKWGFERYRLP